MKTWHVSGWTILVCFFLFGFCGSCEKAGPDDTDINAGGSSEGDGEYVYNRYNIHYYLRGGAHVANCVNYLNSPGHAVLPYNTKFKVGKYRRGFTLVAVDTGLEIFYEYKPGYMGGRSVEDYINMITSSKPVDYSDLREIDRQGIQAGIAKEGMSKQAVMAALGYPAEHRTPSLDVNTWVYWQNRFVTMAVEFDKEGKVSHITR